MTARTRLHNLLDFAIESYKQHHPDCVADVDPDDYDDLWTLMMALRERDRAVARPVVLRALGSVLAHSCDASLRQEAAKHLGEYWDDYQNEVAVVRILTTALFDSADPVRVAAVRALGGMGAVAAGALPALQAIAASSNPVQLRRAIQGAIDQIEHP